MNLKITKPNGDSYSLNPRLIEMNKVSDESVLEIIELHNKKNIIFDMAEGEDNITILRKMSKEVEEIEFAMQKAWRFPQDKSFHEWYLFPKCSCGTLDNSDMRGTKYQCINMECKIHGVE